MSPFALLRALRPHQWVKNIFVLAAFVGAYGDQRITHALQPGAFSRTLFALFAFCLASSSIYLLNDVMDVESDRAHPEKRRRPIAAGEVSIPLALLAMVGCAVLAALLGWFAGGGSTVVLTTLGVYVGINIAYNLRLKHVVLLDAFCIASGFLLRVAAGGQAAEADVSHWLLLCTLFLALFLALNKRRAEIDLLGEDRGAHRATLEEYTPVFIDQMVTFLAACTVVCYTMYTVDEEAISKFGKDNHMVWTVPFVVFGIGRYMFLVQTRRGGGSPTRVLLGGDALFLVNGLVWLALIGAVVLKGW